MIDPGNARDHPEPKASRPHVGSDVPLEGKLPWQWARERLSKSYHYWLTTTRPDGAPHAMPVWGIWLNGAWYCSMGAKTRTAQHLAKNPNCVVCTENAEEAVILEGVARKLPDSEIPRQAFAVYQGEVWLGTRSEGKARVRGATASGLRHAREAISQGCDPLELRYNMSAMMPPMSPTRTCGHMNPRGRLLSRISDWPSTARKTTNVNAPGGTRSSLTR